MKRWSQKNERKSKHRSIENTGDKETTEDSNLVKSDDTEQKANREHKRQKHKEKSASSSSSDRKQKDSSEESRHSKNRRPHHQQQQQQLLKTSLEKIPKKSHTEPKVKTFIPQSVREKSASTDTKLKDGRIEKKSKTKKDHTPRRDRKPRSYTVAVLEDSESHSPHLNRAQDTKESPKQTPHQNLSNAPTPNRTSPDVTFERSTDSGELNNLKDSFSNWKLKELSHSWEIDPVEIHFIEKIGEGTNCSVFRGKYRNQDVALKVLKDLTPKQLNNFTKEFEVMSQCRSPYIVFFFGACIQPIPVMVLQYCSRGSLFSVLKSKENITWPLVIKIANQIVRGLHSLHNWKPQIVHRDLKSKNILVTDDWQIKLCDFGESRQLTGTNLETLCKMRGTYAYIAPEVYYGHSFTTKSDIYSFGIILWELSHRCIRGSYMAPYSEYKHLVYDFQIVVQASRRGIRPTIDKDCPEAISNCIQRCWNADPQVRPDTESLIAFFEEIIQEPDPKKWVNAKTAFSPPPNPITTGKEAT
jgi:hypothetical protein